MSGTSINARIKDHRPCLIAINFDAERRWFNGALRGFLGCGFAGADAQKRLEHKDETTDA
jgi:hypothetical protein